VQEDDILVQKMADLMQNQFGLKPKMQGPAYTPPFPELLQSDLAAKGEASNGVYKVFWAG
jgi:hypothetical protein